MVDRDKMEGTLDEAKGKGQQAWGEATDDQESQGKGQANEAKGKGQQVLGDAKDKAKDLKDKVID